MRRLLEVTINWKHVGGGIKLNSGERYDTNTRGRTEIFKIEETETLKSRR